MNSEQWVGLGLLSECPLSLWRAVRFGTGCSAPSQIGGECSVWLWGQHVFAGLGWW